MTQSLPGHNTPAVGFEAPLEMLAACHGRVQHQCGTLLRLLEHLKVHGPDRPAQEAACAVMRYFDTAARHHHDDEERDLFPALLEFTSGSDARYLQELTASLCADHRVLEGHWAGLRQALLQVAEGVAPALDDEQVSQFVRLYDQHIAREETELLPKAAHLLGEVELDRVGRAMRARRGITNPPE